MKKITKRITSIFLALVMVISISCSNITPVYASSTVLDRYASKLVDEGKKRAISALSDLVGSLPVIGSTYKVLFSTLVSTILEGEPSESFSVEDALINIDSKINDLVGITELSQNNAFNEKVNKVRSVLKKYLIKIEDSAKSRQIVGTLLNELAEFDTENDINSEKMESIIKDFDEKNKMLTKEIEELTKQIEQEEAYIENLKNAEPEPTPTPAPTEEPVQDPVEEVTEEAAEDKAEETENMVDESELEESQADEILLVSNQDEIAEKTAELESLKVKLEELNVKVDELQNLKKNADERTDLVKNINMYNDNIDMLEKEIINSLGENNNLDSLDNTINSIANFILNSEIGQNKQPFDNYYNYLAKSGTISTDIIEKCKIYEEAVMSTYIMASALRLSALTLKVEYEENAITKEQILRKIDSDLATDERVVNFYNDYVARRSGKIIYYNSSLEAVEIAGIQRAVSDMGVFTSLSNYKSNLMLSYFNVNAFVNPEKFAKQEAFLNDMNSFIANNYTSDKFGTYTLRQYLTSVGFEVPEDTKYLLAEKRDANYLKYYDLDAASNTIQRKLFTPAFNFSSSIVYYDSDQFAYFCDVYDTVDFEGGAEVIYKGQVNKYSDIASAWEYAVYISCYVAGGKYDGDVVFKLNEDWVATQLADGTSSFGVGNAFDGGAISTGDRISMANLVLDLNGYTINRNQNKATEKGSVIILGNTSLTIQSSTPGGTITGGNTLGNGGGIDVSESRAIIRDCTITGNKAAKYGGGIDARYDGVKVLDLFSCSITNNSAGVAGGGVYVNLNRYIAGVEVTIGGEMIVTDNTANGKNNNIHLDENWLRKAVLTINSTYGITAGSKIGIFSPTSDKNLTITNDFKSSLLPTQCFEYDNNSYSVVQKGSGNSCYLSIKKK